MSVCIHLKDIYNPNKCPIQRLKHQQCKSLSVINAYSCSLYMSHNTVYNLLAELLSQHYSNKTNHCTTTIIYMICVYSVLVASMLS